MKKNAIYPGTFDPITFGHIDVIKKALKLFDKIVVAVSDGNNKNYLFNSDERIEIVKQALFSDLQLNKKKIIIVSFKSLTTDLCLKYKSNIILRGLRAVSDFEYEFQLAGMNRKLNNNIETVFLVDSIFEPVTRHKEKSVKTPDGKVTGKTIKELHDILLPLYPDIVPENLSTIRSRWIKVNWSNEQVFGFRYPPEYEEVEDLITIKNYKRINNISLKWNPLFIDNLPD